MFSKKKKKNLSKVFLPNIYTVVNFIVSFASLKSLLKKMRMYVLFAYVLMLHSVYLLKFNNSSIHSFNFHKDFFLLLLPFCAHTLFDLRRETFYSYLFFLHYYVSKLCHGTIDENVYFLSIYPKALLLARFEE